ncbi:MAG: anti-sigma factor [Flavobacteriales bacterium]|nr:anti-sigma factor [Flavobacteriales bacterium]
MNADEIISSGMLEAYAMGQLSGADARVVEQACADDPRVRAELDQIEEAFELQAMAAAVAPPPAIKAQVLQAVSAEKKGPATAPPVIPITRDTKAPRSWAWLAAAATIAFVVSAAVNVMVLSELKNVRVELARLENDRSVLAEELQVQRASLERSQNMLAVVSDPRMQVVALNGTAADPAAKARVYWDKERKAVHIDVLQLAQAPAGKQYQLWAIVDGQPVDAGVFDMGDGTAPIQAMKGIGNAQAFAVTLEPEGGSVNPTLEAMVLIGQV